MKVPKFKVGDKVRLSNPTKRKRWNVIGEVINISSTIHVKWNSNKCYWCSIRDLVDCHIPVNDCSCLPRELEKVCIKGEQLLFEFMNE